MNLKHRIDYENAQIIDTASSDLKLRVKELLHILKTEPSLNKQLKAQSDFDIKTLIVQAYPQFRQENEKSSGVNHIRTPHTLIYTYATVYIIYFV